MVNKIIVILHIVVLGIIVAGTVHFKSTNAIISVGTIFFTGCLALYNTINRMLDKQEEHISNR
ncbi:MAG: hypothetical protein Q8935_16050 [Bacillota bacterium]|nr:hypothetical protein [Bacillota bacterium]